MPEFKFIHAADLHLGSPFRGLQLSDPDTARRLAAAGRSAFVALVNRAIGEGVAFILIAGDVYDGDWRDNTIGLFFERELNRLSAAGIEVFLLRGDEDAESVVMRSIALPATVRQFTTAAPSTLRIEALQVALHGQGLAHSAVTENLVSNYPGRVAGWFNIGVLHTSLTGRPPEADVAPCTPGHLRARGYDYWALGHAHDYEVVGTRPHIVYPGNLQGRHIGEKGEKGALLVSVADGEVTAIERLIVDQARWTEIAVEARGLGSEAAVLKAIEEKLAPLAAAAAERPVIVRVVLTGESPAHRQLVAHRDQLTDEAAAAGHRVHGDIWLERLDIKTRAPAFRRRSEPAMLSVDLAALLGEVEHSAELKATTAQLLADIKVRIPGSIGEDQQHLETDLEQLVAEARDLLLTRASDDA